MSNTLDLVAADVVCRKCGNRSRAGYQPTTEPCWADDTSHSNHDWHEYGGLADV